MTPITDQTRPKPLVRPQIEPKPSKPARPKKPELPTHSATRLPTYPATRSQKRLTAPDPSPANPNLNEHATQLLAEEIRHKEELMKIKAATEKKKKRYFPF